MGQTVYYSCDKNSAKKLKQNLLKFPALNLEETIPKFLKTVQPLLTPHEFEEAKCSAKEFMQGEGAKLQKLLENVAKQEENWLASRWLKTAYLGCRAPVTVFSSPGMTFPINKFKNDDEFIMYAAKMIMGLIKYKKIVDDGKIPIFRIGKNELDNSQFGAVYGTCRIPLKGIDDMSYNPKSDHVVVIHKNYVNNLSPLFFHIDL